MSEHRTRDIEIAKIAIPKGRMRGMRFDVVKRIAESLKDSGLLQPIIVRDVGDSFHLVAGRHRLDAAKLLKWHTITARIMPDGVDSNEARLVEIDENLQRCELTPAERAAHIAERKRIYEERHGSAKAIGAKASNAAQGKGGATANLADASFTEDTAKKTGQSTRKVRRDARRGEEIGADALSKVVGTSLDKGEELDALAQLEQPIRDALIDRATKGEKVSAKTEAKKQKHDQNERGVAIKQMRLPQKRYGVVVADPGWDSQADRVATKHYSTGHVDVAKSLGATIQYHPVRPKSPDSRAQPSRSACQTYRTFCERTRSLRREHDCCHVEKRIRFPELSVVAGEPIASQILRLETQGADLFGP
jgi:ParB/RepB/Spo0J family partition protein